MLGKDAPPDQIGSGCMVLPAPYQYGESDGCPGSFHDCGGATDGRWLSSIIFIVIVPLVWLTKPARGGGGMAGGGH